MSNNTLELNRINIKRLIQIFTRKEKKKFFLLFACILIMGILEVAGVALVLPFMQLVAQPEAVEKSTMLTSIYEWFAFTSQKQMLTWAGITIIVMIGLTNLFAVLTIWLQYKFSWDIAHNLSTRLLNHYIKKPYKFFLRKNTTELQTLIISEVGTLNGGLIVPAIEVISRGFIALIIFSLLLFVDPKIALISFGGLGFAYLLIYLFRQNYLKEIGKYRLEMNLARFKSLTELLGGIKTIMAYNQRSLFYNRYDEASREFCNVQPRYNLLLSAPKYLLEFLAFGSVLVVTIVLFSSSGNIQTLVPRLSLYAVAGYRLLPALQKAFSAAAKLKHNFPILDRLYPQLVDSLKTNLHTQKSKELLPFEDSISLKDISFRYENSERHILKDLSITIKKGETIAFVGSTGSGKTTIVDLIIGLLTPTEGAISVDNTPIAKSTVKLWQNNLAYVSQDVFLFDDSILQNIVLAEDKEEVNHKRLRKALRLADIYKLVFEELHDGLDTKIGEKGIRLSGGQRQRIGLARALYKNPSVLILDEATSALDSVTEKGIIDSLRAMNDNITQIIIAHRLSTVKHADKIYMLENGKIAAIGNYASLINSSENFQKMVQLS